MMSVQRLNDKNAAKIARATGLDVVRAWSHGVHHVYAFVVADPDHPDLHRHGEYDDRDGSFVLAGIGRHVVHYSTCRELFPRPNPGGE